MSDTPETEKLNGRLDYSLTDGMSLRDYFAGKALTGLVLGNDYGNSSDADIAKGAYEYADAMLEARTLNQEP
jgi:hypothetical protein